jgi:hypothetical protein
VIKTIRAILQEFSGRVYEEIDKRRSVWAMEESKGSMFMLPYHIFP